MGRDGISGLAALLSAARGRTTGIEEAFPFASALLMPRLLGDALVQIAGFSMKGGDEVRVYVEARVTGKRIRQRAFRHVRTLPHRHPSRSSLYSTMSGVYP